MNLLRSKLILCFTICLLCATAKATQREVGPTGNYRTIGAAIAAAAANDTINIHSGTYRENPVVGKKLIVQANTGEMPVVVGHILVAADYVTISGLEITGWGATAAITDGILQDWPGHTGLTVTKCKIHAGSGLGSPINVGGLSGGAAAGIRVRYSTKTNISFNNIYGCIKGVRIQSAHSSDGTFANGTVIANNNIHDCPIDGINLHGQYMTVVGNNIYDNMDSDFANTHPDGIQIIAVVTDGYDSGSHLRIMRNTIFNHTQNIFVQGSKGGEASPCADVLIADNLCYVTPNVPVHGQLVSAMPGGGIGIAVGQLNGGWIYNNTVLDSTRGIGLEDSKNGTVHLKNNLMRGAIVAMRVDDPNDVPAGELNNNLYYNDSHVINWRGAFYKSIADFRRVVPTQESASLEGDPKLAATTHPLLQSGSAAIGRGVNLNSFCPVDRDNNVRPSSGPWDMGAFMYLSQLALSPPTSLRVVQ